MLLTPLEQFQIISLFSFKVFCLDFSFTNLFLINIIVLILYNIVVYFFSSDTNYLEETTFFFIPNNWQILLETIYELSSQLLFDNINVEGEKYFPFISVLFTFILFSNLIGLIPYSFTITSHLIVTFTLSLSIFIGVNLISMKQDKFHMLSLFIPANTSFGLALLLVPIEFVSYIFKPISLGVRLFANLMAGHPLLQKGVRFFLSLFVYALSVVGIVSVFIFLFFIIKNFPTIIIIFLLYGSLFQDLYYYYRPYRPLLFYSRVNKKETKTILLIALILFACQPQSIMCGCTSISLVTDDPAFNELYGKKETAEEAGNFKVDILTDELFARYRTDYPTREVHEVVAAMYNNENWAGQPALKNFILDEIYLHDFCRTRCFDLLTGTSGNDSVFEDIKTAKYVNKQSAEIFGKLSSVSITSSPNHSIQSFVPVMKDVKFQYEDFVSYLKENKFSSSLSLNQRQDLDKFIQGSERYLESWENLSKYHYYVERI